MKYLILLILVLSIFQVNKTKAQDLSNALVERKVFDDELGKTLNSERDNDGNIVRCNTYGNNSNKPDRQTNGH